MLCLILALLICIRDIAFFVRFKEQHFSNAFVGVDARGQRSGVRNFECDMPFPLRLKGSDIDDDAAAGISAFPQAHCQHLAWDAEIFNRPRQCE